MLLTSRQTRSSIAHNSQISSGHLSQIRLQSGQLDRTLVSVLRGRLIGTVGDYQLITVLHRTSL